LAILELYYLVLTKSFPQCGYFFPEEYPIIKTIILSLSSANDINLGNGRGVFEDALKNSHFGVFSQIHTTTTTTSISIH